MRKTPQGWIQIGECRTRGVARIPLGLKPSRDSRATSQWDSPIWIQPLGVFRYKIIKIVDDSLDFHLGSCKHLNEVENVSGIFFFFFFWGGGTDKGLIKDFVLKFLNLCYFSFQLWLMKNKHQISLPIFRPEKNGQHFAHNIFKWIFLLKKYCLSFCLPLCLSVFLSFCLSVCLSVPFTPFSLCSHHGIIMKFSGVITNDRSDVYAKV